MAKDLFSNQSQNYARYRPTYPSELFDYLLQWVPARDRAWDCATGNGQAAQVLATHFKEVDATDLSSAQLSNAIRKENIHYRESTAEHTPFADSSFDLITVATAYHWFNWKEFRTEVMRVAKPGAVIAVWAYSTLYSNDEALNRLILHFYNDIIKAYWDPERGHVEDKYAKVEFDYEPLPSKDFETRVEWTRGELVGYLESWSAVQHYIEANGSSPLDQIQDELQECWPDGDERKRFVFPVFTRIGKIVK